MGDELIRLCDGIERHGLVDYQFGVWEDEIESCKHKRHLLPPKKGWLRQTTWRVCALTWQFVLVLEDCVKLFEERDKDARRRDHAQRNR